MKIVVLGGGISTERSVSLVTATSVCRALRDAGHKAIFVDLFLGFGCGVWREEVLRGMNFSVALGVFCVLLGASG